MTGAIACGHEHVGAAARRVIESGGNAYDAAVAAGFASAVAEPGLTSLGGGGFLLARTAAGAEVVFDFFADTPGRGADDSPPAPHFVPITVRFPSSEQVFHCGLGSAAVPGALGGYLHVHERLGRLPLAEVVAPAADLARRGVEVTPVQAYVLGLLEPILTMTEAGRDLFAPSGRVASAGALLRNEPLAAFLEVLPREGARAFYEGPIARSIAHDMRDGGGGITERDLAEYRVHERRPLAVGYRDAHVLTNPPPAFGGSLLALSLRLLELGDVARMGHGSLAHLRFLVAVMREVDRRRAEACSGSGVLPAAAWGESAGRVRRFSRGTTHVSVCDRDGNLASMTTSNGEGSGYVVPGTGIMVNNMLGEDDLHPEGFHATPPGRRVSSMMSPSMVFEGGHARLVVGSGGSKRIRTALLQVISNVVDFGMGLADAVTAPRLHWDGESVQVEPGFEDAPLADLSRSLPVNAWGAQDVYFGGAHAVDESGSAAGDPRRGGWADVLEPSA